jgi:hypothetical protein
MQDSLRVAHLFAWSQTLFPEMVRMASFLQE